MPERRRGAAPKQCGLAAPPHATGRGGAAEACDVVDARVRLPCARCVQDLRSSARANAARGRPALRELGPGRDRRGGPLRRTGPGSVADELETAGGCPGRPLRPGRRGRVVPARAAQRRGDLHSRTACRATCSTTSCTTCTTSAAPAPGKVPAKRRRRKTGRQKGRLVVDASRPCRLRGPDRGRQRPFSSWSHWALSTTLRTLAAWTSSIAHIRATPGFAGRPWPDRPFSSRRTRRTWCATPRTSRNGLASPIRCSTRIAREVIGCVYLYPPRQRRLRRRRPLLGDSRSCRSR